MLIIKNHHFVSIKLDKSVSFGVELSFSVQRNAPERAQHDVRADL